ncbi:hypothetical protein P9112_002438 [Eukaryota sp. TZLM1-RC]
MERTASTSLELIDFQQHPGTIYLTSTFFVISSSQVLKNVTLVGNGSTIVLKSKASFIVEDGSSLRDLRIINQESPSSALVLSSDQTVTNCEFKLPVFCRREGSNEVNVNFTNCNFRGSFSAPLLTINASASVSVIDCMFKSGTVGVSNEGRLTIKSCKLIGQSQSSLEVLQSQQHTTPSAQNSLTCTDCLFFGSKNILYLDHHSSMVSFSKSVIYDTMTCFDCLNGVLSIVDCEIKNSDLLFSIDNGKVSCSNVTLTDISKLFQSQDLSSSSLFFQRSEIINCGSQFTNFCASDLYFDRCLFDGVFFIGIGGNTALTIVNSNLLNCKDFLTLMDCASLKLLNSEISNSSCFVCSNESSSFNMNNNIFQNVQIIIQSNDSADVIGSIIDCEMIGCDYVAQISNFESLSIIRSQFSNIPHFSSINSCSLLKFNNNKFIKCKNSSIFNSNLDFQQCTFSNSELFLDNCTGIVSKIEHQDCMFNLLNGRSKVQNSSFFDCSITFMKESQSNLIDCVFQSCQMSINNSCLTIHSCLFDQNLIELIEGSNVELNNSGIKNQKIGINSTNSKLNSTGSTIHYSETGLSLTSSNLIGRYLTVTDAKTAVAFDENSVIDLTNSEISDSNLGIVQLNSSVNTKVDVELGDVTFKSVGLNVGALSK